MYLMSSFFSQPGLANVARGFQSLKFNRENMTSNTLVIDNGW